MLVTLLSFSLNSALAEFYIFLDTEVVGNISVGPFNCVGSCSSHCTDAMPNVHVVRIPQLFDAVTTVVEEHVNVSITYPHSFDRNRKVVRDRAFS